MKSFVPQSLVGRLVLWVIVLLALVLPMIWFLFAQAVDRISRDTVDARLVEFAGQVRGYWVSVRADGLPSGTINAAGGADLDWVWQVAADGNVVLRSELLTLTDLALPVRKDKPSDDFILHDVETELGSLRIAERMVIEPVDGAVAGETVFEKAHYVVGLRSQRYVGYVQDHAERLQGLALLAIIPVALALFGLAAVIIQATRRNLQQLGDALQTYEQGHADRIEGHFAVELQRVADRVNVLLERNEKLVERTRKYVSKITHDINHPLAVLKNALGGDDETALMQRQVVRMTGLIDRYSSLARAIGPEGQDSRSTSIKVVLDDVVDGFSILYRRTPLAFEVLCRDDFTTTVPQHDLEAMISNLVSNAHKYGDSRVRVSAERDQTGALFVHVDDDGPGIPDEQREIVTNWGKRLDEAPPGTGFGLTIVRDIADLYEGTLELGRSDIGGLRVTIMIPPTKAQ